MVDRITDPAALLEFRLTVALTMEHDSLAMLGELEKAAQSAEAKKMFSHHAEETSGQIENLEKAFELLEFELTTAPSPTTKGLSKEGSALIEATTEEMRDIAVLGAALGTEHYEIAAYLNLIATTDALGKGAVQALLVANLEQEQHTSEELQAKVEKLLGEATR